LVDAALEMAALHASTFHPPAHQRAARARPAPTHCARCPPLQGSLPEAWGALRNLTTLQLQGNRLSGGVPASWPARLPRLAQLNLSANVRMCGVLPAFDPDATRLAISDTQLGQDCPAPTLSSSVIATVAGITVAACVACMVAVVGLVSFMRRAQQRRAATRRPPPPLPGAGPGSPSLYMNPNSR
jgi:hypothetical protein